MSKEVKPTMHNTGTDAAYAPVPGLPSEAFKRPSISSERRSTLIDSLYGSQPKLNEGDWNCDQESYRYLLSEAQKDPWGQCFEVVDKNDEQTCKTLEGEISSLLVVASLFLGVVTAFTNQSFKWLREDKDDTIIHFLDQTLRILNDTTRSGTAQTPPPFSPSQNDIIINELWFFSLILSLSAVVIGTLCLQWLKAFRQPNPKNMPHDDVLAIRQLRYEGFVNWGVPRVPAILLLMVQGSLILFAIGLIYLLWSVSNRVAFAAAIIGGIVTILLILTTFGPLLQSISGWFFPQTLSFTQCPFKSPLSWFVHRTCVLIAIALSLVFGWWKPVAKWRQEQFTIVKDLMWQNYDEHWRRRREKLGPQSSKTNPLKFSYYLARGLASAMEIFMFRQSSVHIVHACLQDFHGTVTEVETFQILFGKQFNDRERQLLSIKCGNNNRRRRHFRKDFLNANALQHFVSNNHNLQLGLLPHRLELFIRILNTSLCMPNDDMATGLGPKPDQWIGRSLTCPIREEKDVQCLPTDLKVQFVNCLNHFFQQVNDQFITAPSAYSDYLNAACLVVSTVVSHKQGVALSSSLKGYRAESDHHSNDTHIIQHPSEITLTPSIPSSITQISKSKSSDELGNFEIACSSLLWTLQLTVGNAENIWRNDQISGTFQLLKECLSQSTLAGSLPPMFQLGLSGTCVMSNEEGYLYQKPYGEPFQKDELNDGVSDGRYCETDSFV